MKNQYFPYPKQFIKTSKALYYRTFMALALTGLSLSSFGQAVEMLAKVLVTDVYNTSIQLEYFVISSDTSNSISLVSTSEFGVVFSIRRGDSTPFILEVKGQGGVGRVYVNPKEVTDTIRITYPVEERIVILHTNDRHFDVNRLDEFQSTVNQFREEHPDVFLLDAGDVFVRSPKRWVEEGVPKPNNEWYFQRATLMIETMNEVGYHAMTLGNHELDYVSRFTGEALLKAQFPLLAANIEVTSSIMPSPQPYTVLSTSTGRNVTVIGLSYLSDAKESLAMKDPVSTMDKYVELRGESDILMALTHIGLQADIMLAQLYPQLDAIIGGHTHDLLSEARVENGVLIAQAGGNEHVVSSTHPVYLGVVTITLENGTITGKSGYVITVDE